jgi:hypothetical protein
MDNNSQLPNGLPMLNLERTFQSERLLRAMTGLNRKAFEALLPSFATAYEKSRVKAGEQRQRSPGRRRKSNVTDKSRQAVLYPDVLQMLSHL